MCLPNVNFESVEATIQLGPGGRHLVHLHGSTTVLRELMKQAVRCAAVLEMWASADSSSWAAVSVAAFSSACGLESWLQCQAPATIGVVLDRHSNPQPVIWCVNLDHGADCRRSVSCADVGTSCGQCHQESWQTLPTPPPAVKPVNNFPGSW